MPDAPLTDDEILILDLLATRGDYVADLTWPTLERLGGRHLVHCAPYLRGAVTYQITPLGREVLGRAMLDKRRTANAR